MRRSILLPAGFIPLLVGVVQTLGESENIADRLVQRFSPDISLGRDGSQIKPKLQVNFETQQTKFSRASVEAAPDTIETVVFSKPKFQTYSRSDNALPFNRDFVESGSLKRYGALDPTQGIQENREYQGGNYFGAADPSLFLKLYSGSQFQQYSYEPKEEGKRIPLRSAVEKRPDPTIARLYRARTQVKALADLRKKYLENQKTTFRQARPNPIHKNGQHTEQLEELLTKSSNQEYKIVCYYGAWSVYRTVPYNFGVTDIDPFSCTHLIYSFAGLQPDNLTIISLDTEEDIIKGSYKSAVALKLKNPALKVMIAIGGWNEGGKTYSEMASSPASRARFIKSVVEFIEEHSFDGLDLDWEYPGAGDRDGQWSDKENFASLVSELHDEFEPRGWLLSAAVSPAKFRVDEGYAVKKIAEYLDFINVMTYDLHGDWDNFVDHHAPLNSREHDSWEFKSLNTAAGLGYWKSKGAPLHKLLLGTPFYGRSFTLSSENSKSPGSRSSGPGKPGEFTDEAGFLAYYEICRMIKDGGWTEETDSDGNPYIYKGDQWVGYDKVESVRRKMEYVRSKGLGGAMIWAIDLDDYRGDCGTKSPLLTNMNLILRPKGGEVPETDEKDFGLFQPDEDSGVIAAVTAEIDEDNSALGGAENFICAGPGSFPSSTSCSDYFTCTQDGQAFRFSCPDGLHYDPSIGACNWPEAVSCSIPTQAQTRQFCGAFGLFYDPVAKLCTPFRVSPGYAFQGFPQIKSSPLILYNTEERKKVICYFSNWAGIREGDGKYVPENIPSKLCTHVVYAFAKLDEEKFVPVSSGPLTDLDQDYFSRVHDTVKTRNPNAKVLISVGGWADSAGSKYSTLVNSQDLRNKFVRGSMQFLKKYRFDGMVMEWHFPVCWQSDCTKGPDSDRAGFSNLAQDLKREFGKRFTIGATLSGYQQVIDKAYDIASLSENLDFLNIMSYDLHGFWEDKTMHHAPLSDPTSVSVEGLMNKYLSLGADKSKLVVGIPFYGQSFLTKTEGVGYGVDSKGPGAPGQWTKQPGMLGFNEICLKIKEGWTQSEGQDGRQDPFAYYTVGNQWVGFDSVQSVRRKAEFAMNNGFAGVSISTLDLDDFNNLCCLGAHPLLNSVSSVILGTPGPEPGCSRPAPPVTPAPRPQETTEAWDDGSNRKPSSTSSPNNPKPTTSSTAASSTTSSTDTDSLAECTEGEHIKHPQDCQKYYRCINGKKQLHSCSGGLSWNAENLMCDWSDNVSCGSISDKNFDEVVVVVDETDDQAMLTLPGLRCSNPGQLSQIPGDCSSFYQCNNNEQIKQSCSPGLHFSSAKGICDWPEAAGCVTYFTLERDGTCQEGSRIPHPTDCASYLWCVHSEYIQLSCQQGTHWDRNMETCNHPEAAGCTSADSAQGTPSATPTTTTSSWDSGDNSWDNGDNSWDNEDNSWDNGDWSGDNSGQWKPPTPKPTTQRPTGPTEAVPLQGPLSGDFKVVCYFTNWAWYRPGAGKYKPEDIDPTICTHIVYGFAVLDYSTLLMKPHDSWADIDNDFYGKVTEFKKYGIKVTVAIGGWNDSEGDKYSRLVNNPSARARFIENVVKFIEKYNFDGLDLDWEYPGCWQTECKEERYKDKDSFAAWVRELKEAFKPRGLLLSAAVSPSKKIIDVGYDVPSIARDLDWIAVMTYDYHGHWDKRTGHVAPFYSHPDDEFFYFNTNYTINYWIESGAPATKLVLGMPLYGQAFTLDDPEKNGLNAPAGQKGQAGEFTRAAGFLAYYEICSDLKKGGWTVVKDPEGRMGPYAYKGRQWVGYDDVDTIRRKSEFVREMGLGGGMVWALDLDDFRNVCGEGPHPLMNAIQKVLGPKKGDYEGTRSFELDTTTESASVTPPMNSPATELTITTTSPTRTKKEDSEYKVVCYFTNWAWYRPGAGKYKPEDIDEELCTHIVYGFAVLDPRTHLIRAHDSWADFDNEFYKKVTALKSAKKKVLLALGGWNDSAGDKYSKLVNDPEKRKKFVDHALAFIKKNNFDGLDLDWEYPRCWQVDCDLGPKSDKDGFSAWIRELSAAFKPEGLLVTAAVSPSNKVIDAGYDVPELSKYLDYVSVMTYDYHGQWDKKTGHVAPMYQHSGDDNIFFNVNYTVNYWLSGGLDRRKLILGMPMYGQSFTLASAADNGLNSRSYGGGTAGPFTRARGFLAYYEICHNIQTQGWKVIQDPTGTMGPYAYKGTQWVSFDDTAMIKHKTQYLKNMKLGGAMIWALDLDDFRNSCGCESNPLLNTINRELKGAKDEANCDMSGNYRIGDIELSPSPYSGCNKGNFAPSEADCSEYYVCNNGEYQLQKCPSGLHWNRDRCDWPESSSCFSSGGLAQIPEVVEVDNDISNEIVEVEAPSSPVKPTLDGTSSNTGIKVVCYFTNWAWYRQGLGKYKPENIDPELCTHINYGFAVLDPTNLIMVPHDTWADIDNKFFSSVAALKSKGITVSIALGGWNDSEGDKYSKLVNNPSSRSKFISEAVKFIEKYGFQGLDLDWEYPKCWQVDCSLGPESDKASFAAFVKELSAEFKPRGWVLSAAVSPSKTVIDAGYDVPALNQYLDIINVMTYDYHGHWDKKTGHVAPLYAHPQDDYSYFNANFTMNYWVTLGASKSKLVMGMPMYGQAFSLSDSSETGLNSPARGKGEAGEFTRAAGFLAYYEICEKVRNSAWTIVQDPENRLGPVAFNGDQWVGYDDITMIRRKSQFIKDNGFGGGMIWALDLDDFTNRCGCETYPLLKTINRVLRDYSAPDPSCELRAMAYNNRYSQYRFPEFFSQYPQPQAQSNVNPQTYSQNIIPTFSNSQLQYSQYTAPYHYSAVPNAAYYK